MNVLYLLVSGIPLYFLSSSWGVSSTDGIACLLDFCVFYHCHCMVV